MTPDQILAFAIITVMMALFVWGRFRYDLVAAIALLAAVLSGIVPYEKAFSGFSDDIVIIVASALVVSGTIARSGVMEAVLHRIAPHVTTVQAQLFVLVALVTVLSAFVKNIGALAIMIPVAMQMARRSNVSASTFLMPMSFGALLGGLMTQIGTSPNIIVSRVREELTGTPFTMFDFTPVGVALAITGLLFLTFFYRLLPERKGANGGLVEAIDINNYMTEAVVTEDSSIIGKTVGELQSFADGGAMVTAILNTEGRRMRPLPDVMLRDGDILLIEGDPDSLDNVVSRGKLKLEGRDRKLDKERGGEIGTIEAVIGENSSFAGLSAQRLALFEKFGVNLLAVSRQGERFTERLGEITLRFGDLVVLQGNLKLLPETLREFGLLPLAERSLRLGNVRRGLVPMLILLAAMGLTAFSVLPVAVAFFAAAILMMLVGAIPLRDAYDSIEWPIIVMLAALIPVSGALQSTGGTDLIARELSELARMLPSYGALALILVTAMAVTPFLNNAATVLIMAPIAASFAGDLGYRPEAFLMAVAIGAGCDFLTPIGHQCNTLVMGPGGYRFADYGRLGLPLSLLIVMVGVPALMLAWPLS